MLLEDLKLKDIELFLRLTKTKSVRDLGRESNLSPGQVSKWIQGMEHKLGRNLIERSSQGVQPTAEALELIPVFEKFMALQSALKDPQSIKKDETLNFGSSSYFSTYLIPLLTKELGLETSRSVPKIRIIDLPPANFVTAALRGAFNLCFHTHALEFPKTWTTVVVGEVELHLYCRKNHPILKASSAKNLLKYPFVSPVYWTAEGNRYGDDQCPIPLNKRLKGHEASSSASACELIKHSDQLAFFPEIVARQSLKAGEIRQVPVPWKTVKKPVFLSVKNAVVKQNDFELLQRLSRKILGSI